MIKKPYLYGESPLEVKEDFMEDSRILDLYFERSEDAIKETDSKYGRLCLRISRNILGDEHEAEECRNDTYLAVWNSIPPTRPENFTAFLARVARNLSLKRLEYKSAQKRAALSMLSLSELEEFLPDEHFRYEIEDESLGELISMFLYGEREDVRGVFVRRYFFCDDIKTIAKSYGFSESKVKSILFHLRSRLKKFLVEKGVYL